MDPRQISYALENAWNTFCIMHAPLSWLNILSRNVHTIFSISYVTEGIIIEADKNNVVIMQMGRYQIVNLLTSYSSINYSNDNLIDLSRDVMLNLTNNHELQFESN